MMKLDSNIYQKLINNINITEIALKELAINKSATKKHENIEITVKHEIGPYRLVENFLTVETLFNITGSKENESVFNINFTLELIYELEPNLYFAEEYIEFFTTNNVPVNAWPYARELVSNLTLRMGLSALVLPVFRIQ